jgi:hypothetical protein
MDIRLKLIGIVAASALCTSVFAQEEVIGDDGYNKTYNDESKSFGQRMKEARTPPKVVVENTYGGFTLGVVGDFGPVYDADPNSSSGMGFGFGFEPGYIIQTDSWSRIELGAEIAYRSFDWKHAKDTSTTITPMSVTPRIGWGQSMGGNIFGLLRFGFGFANAQASFKEAGITSKTDEKLGFVLTGGYDMSYGAGMAQFFGGLGVNHFRWNFSELKTGSVTDSSFDGRMDLNYVNLRAGMRLKF